MTKEIIIGNHTFYSCPRPLETPTVISRLTNGKQHILELVPFPDAETLKAWDDMETEFLQEFDTVDFRCFNNNGHVIMGGLVKFADRNFYFVRLEGTDFVLFPGFSAKARYYTERPAKDEVFIRNVKGELQVEWKKAEPELVEIASVDVK